MPAPYQRRVMARSGARPNRAWSGLQLNAINLVAPTNIQVLATGTPVPAGVDHTILRTRGHFTFFGNTAGGLMVGALGMIVTTDAVTTQVPGPIVDADNDGWFVYEPFAFAMGISPVNTDNAVIKFDSRAKRIVPDGYHILVVLETTNTSTGVDISMVMRCLSQIRGTR